MELHSYAKRRTLKKWTIEQKRKLVKARIEHDSWFTSKPSSVVPWKNVLAAANLDDFNVFFVRKQWCNMLARYKLYKQTRLGSNIASKAIDSELIKRINQEWEFFEPIHKFMTRKTTNLHSYAITHRTDNENNEQQEIEEGLIQSATRTEQDHHHHHNQTNKNNETITIKLPKECVKENIPNNTTIIIQANNISPDDSIHLFSSDTNDEFQVIAEATKIINVSKERQVREDENMNCVRNTDHDFYSKKFAGDIANEINSHKTADLEEQQSNYFADASEESQGSLNMVVDLLKIINTTNARTPLNGKIANDNKLADIDLKSDRCEIFGLKEEMASTSTQTDIIIQNITNPPTAAKPRLSERDKYFRHKRRFDRRLEQRFDAILQVMFKIVEVEYPTVDVTPLVSTVTALASTMDKMLSSGSEDDNSSDESDTNIPKTATNVNH